MKVTEAQRGNAPHPEKEGATEGTEVRRYNKNRHNGGCVHNG